MKTRVFRKLIACVVSGALFVSQVGALMSLNVATVQAATMVKQRYVKIEDNDTVSDALVRYFPCLGGRLWGAKGAVDRISFLNPHIRDLNRVRPGMLIDIGEYAKTSTCKKRTSASLNPTEFASVREPESENQSKTEREQKQKSERYGFFEVMPEFSFSRINSVDSSTGGSAIFSSNLMPGVRLSWGQNWSSRVQTSLSLGIRSETYVAPAGYALVNSSSAKTDFGLDIRWVPFKEISDLAIDTGIGFRQDVFARATSLTSVNLDATMIPEFSAGLRYRILDLSPFTLTLYGQGLILFPQSTSNYSIQSGTGSIFGATFAEDISKKMRLSGGLQYSTRSQDTSIATQTRTDISLSFGITFKLGDPQ